ncbi:MAG: flavodoxin family protein [Clostridiales bacterium]|nr:flavodoxin family protein [Clostridiales bacterium]
MKIIAVLGSPSKNGNTCVLAREVLKGAKDSGAEVEEILLADYEIEYCKGCIGKNINDMCMSTGNCIIHDDINLLKQKLYDSDGIILASPAYGLMETARMKNFLVDRIGMYTAYTSRLADKYFVGVSTCGGIGANKVAKNLAKHFIAGFHKRGYMTGFIGVKLGYERIESKPTILEKAYKMGKKLTNDIKYKKKYPFQKIVDRVIIALIVKKKILNNIYENKDDIMKAVYEDLVKRGLIKKYQ